MSINTEDLLNYFHFTKLTNKFLKLPYIQKLSVTPNLSGHVVYIRHMAETSVFTESFTN